MRFESEGQDDAERPDVSIPQRCDLNCDARRDLAKVLVSIPQRCDLNPLGECLSPGCIGFNPATVRFECWESRDQGRAGCFNPATVRFEFFVLSIPVIFTRFNPATVRFEYSGLEGLWVRHQVSIPQRCDLNRRRARGQGRDVVSIPQRCDLNDGGWTHP